MEHAFSATTQPWRVVRCSSCGIAYTDPRPPASDWHLYYPDNYGPYHASSTRPKLGKRLKLTLESWSAKAAKRGPMSLISRWMLPPVVPPVFGEGRMIDIGCGACEYLVRMRAAGWDVQGLEPSATAAQRARERFGIKITTDYFPSAKLPKESFDLVTAHQVMEHVENPLDSLRAMHSILRPGGRILLTMPNTASWSAKFFRSAWIGWDLPRHLTHFDSKSAAKMATDAGFRVLKVRTLSQGGWMRESAAISDEHGLPVNRSYFHVRNLSDTVARITTLLGRGDNLLLIAEKF